MTTQKLQTRVAIAGGGPAGIMLGYLLARAGIKCVVFEKWPDFFRDFRGDTVHPATLEILNELGLLEEFLQLPHNKMTTMSIRIKDKEIELVDFSHLKSKCPYIAFIPQWDFLNFLSEQAAIYSGFKLLMQTEVTDLIYEQGRVVGLRANNQTGGLEIRADLVVGADGRHSLVREKASFAIEKLGVPIDVLWFRIARTGKDDLRSLGYLDAGGALVMLDRHNYWQCAFIINKNQFETIKQAGLDAFRSTIATLARLPLSALAEVDSWDKVKLLSVSVDHVTRWAKEGVLLIGDAAHAMSPIGGVGINYAIADAVATANILAPALQAGVPPLALLEQVQKRRAKPTLKMQRLQVFIQNRIFSPTLNHRKKFKEPWVFRLFYYFPFLRRFPARIIGLGFLPEHVNIRWP